MYRAIQLADLTESVAAPAAAIALFAGTMAVPETLAELDQQFGGTLAAALQRPEFSTAKGSLNVLYAESSESPPAPGAGAPRAGAPGRLYVLGLGDRDKFDGDILRAAMAQLTRAAFSAKVTELALHLLPTLDGTLPPEQLPPEQIGAAIADGISAAQFSFDDYKGAAGTPAPEAPLEIAPEAPEAASSTPANDIDLTLQIAPALRDAADRWFTINVGQTTARTLAATPPNVANPAYLVDYCRTLAADTGLTVRIIDQNEAHELNMGGLLGVGSGSATPPALICLEWNGQEVQSSKFKGQSSDIRHQTSEIKHSPAPVMLVGKAVTFDTGGYSLKPPASMAGMKYDKCGGMAVLGAMQAVARLKLPIPVVGLIPTAENMIDERAYRVDDILKMSNGVTVEITNTDAEGRLILADALAYGTKTYQPRAVIDLATLTGGVVVALGLGTAGLFCNDTALQNRFEQASRFTGEKLWPMPLWDEHRERMKGTHADLANSAGREGSPIQGAAFLSFFVGEEAPTRMPSIPWAHLDIAGSADARNDTALYKKGPTGYGVRLLLRVLEQWV